MNVKHILPVLLAGSIMCAAAAPLTPEQALERALNDKTCTKIIGRNQTASMHLLYNLAASTSDESVCYVFSTPSQGFVMLAADDRAEPVLGYGDTPFDAHDMPDGLRYMLDMYAAEISQAQPYRSPHIIYKQREALEPIAPMLTTKWDQDTPYNLLCPKQQGRYCYTGCVATALAQIANYYHYPTQGTGTSTYNWNGTSLTFDFGATTFDWANMLDAYPTTGNSLSNPACNAVATLMYAIGVASQMDYSLDGSGAYDQAGLDGMVRHLGYNPNARLAQRHLYGILQWEQLVYDNLSKWGPVYYSGTTLASNGEIEAGHAFVCDGYASDGYFHINWGWGGVSDGYYLLSALSPDALGAGAGAGVFNYMQYCSVDLAPATVVGEESQPYHGMYMYIDFKIEPEQAPLGADISYDICTVNLSTETLATATFGLRIESADGESIITESAKGSKIKPHDITYKPQVTARLPKNLADGTYTVRPGFKGPDGTWHDFYFEIGLTKYYYMEVDGGVATFAKPGLVDIQGEIIDIETPIVDGLQGTCTVKLHNPTDQEFFNKIMLLLFDTTGETLLATGGYSIAALLPGETTVLSLAPTFTDIPPGTYLLVPSTETTEYFVPIGEGIYVEVIEMPEGELEVKLINPQVETTINDEDGTGHLDVGFDARCTSGGGTINLSIAINDPKNQVVYSDYSTMQIVEGQTKHCTFTFDIADVVKKRSYQLFYGWFDDGGNWVDYGYYRFQFNEAGLTDITAMPEPISTETYDIAGRKAQPSQKGYVIRIHTMPDGTRRTAKVSQ